jgi:hypothetical protein
MLLSLIIMLIVEPVHLGEDDKPYMMPVHEPTEDTAANGRKLGRDVNREQGILCMASVEASTKGPRIAG